MSQIISLEIGNITTSVMSENGSFTFESRIAEAQDHHLLDNDREIFEVDNKKFVVEMGKFENNIYKYEKKNFVNIMKYAIGKVAKSGNVKVITSIPANQYNSFKDEMKHVMMSNNKISVIVDGEEKNITIEELGILPEGYSVYKTTPKEFLVAGAKTIIIDIGGGTSELIFIDENGKFVNGDTVNTGLLDLFDIVQSDIQSKTKKLLPREDIRKYIDGELAVIGLEGYDFSSIVDKFAGDLINSIKGKAADIDQCNVIVAGGGAKILKKEFNKDFTQALFNTDVTSLCKSNYKVAVAKWKK